MLRGIYTIPAGWPFVDALAAGILAEIGSDPAALADVTILLPTRRAVRSLREAFLRQSEGKPLLLPRMTPLGDIDEDELVIAGDESLSGGLDVPPAISGLRRQLMLAYRIRQIQPDMPVEQAAMLALELGRLIDRVHTEGLNFDRLGNIVDQEFAEHWRQILEFLKIITDFWPDLLAKQGVIDAADRRNRLLKAEAQRWESNPPHGLVIAAGSTGSIPATANLLALIPNLPRGVLVLPGFDASVTHETAEEIRHNDAQHPQYGMLRLLDRMNVPTASVRTWPAEPKRVTHPDRAGLLSEVMRTAKMTDAWRDIAKPSGQALDNLSRIDCPGADEEAGVIALIMRETLQTPARTAALVTPDRTLARRVAAELRRWNIEIDDSAGRPLATTPVGAFLRLAAELAAEDFAPVALLAFAKHPLAACGMAPATLRRAIRRIEIAILRGPRREPGIAKLRDALGDSRASAEHDLKALLDMLEQASAPFVALMAQPQASLADLIGAHVRFAEALAASDTQSGDQRLWAGDDGEAAAAFVAETNEAAGALGTIPPASYPGLLDTLLGGRVVRPRYGAHPRLFIWGLLEARLQHTDVMILGGLNEGTWPPDSESDPWMSRPMRKAFGLPPPERRIGLTAHDFAQAYNAHEVVLTRAQRIDGTPTVPARWLVKLEKILTKFEMLPAFYSARTPRQWLHWQDQLDAPETTHDKTDRRPAPKPPVAARPRRLAATRIETWMRDPYAIYAQYILRLYELDPIDAPPSHADYGDIIHRVLDEFCRTYPTTLPADIFAVLSALGEKKFAERSVPPGVRTFWWPRFLRIAQWFAETEAARRAGLAEIKSELRGELILDGPAGPFTVFAFADRIDRMQDGRLQIFDYKTGAAPTPKEVAAGFAPQLPLEAMIAMAGGFPDIPKGEVARLSFLRLSGGNPAGEERSAAAKDDSPGALADAAEVGLKGLIASFDDPNTPYEARPRPDMAPRYSAYEHLARVKEWAAGPDSSGGGEGGE